MRTIPFSYYRGGTSKAIFLHEKDIPPPGATRDRVLKRLMGSPDPMQIDGMGGTHIVTSKIAIIQPSGMPGIDVDYNFAQVSIKDDQIGYHANCGNISSAVGPFAITENLIKQFRPGVSPSKGVKTQLVRFYVTGTKKVMEEHVPIDEKGNILAAGDFSIDGCPGTGAPILIDCKDTIGGACNSGMLPTGNIVDETNVSGRATEYTICDVGNIVVFARASDFDIRGDEAPADLDNDTTLIAKIRELRGKAAHKVGLCQDWEKVDEEAGALPMVALVSSATLLQGHIQSRLFLDNKCHTAMAGTGSVCHAACSRIKRTIVNQLMKSGTEEENVLSIQHPLGFMPAAVVVKGWANGTIPDFETLSFVRTARRILKGELDVPDDVKEVFRSAMAQVKPQTNGVPLTNGVATNGLPPSPTKAFVQFASSMNSSFLTAEVIEKLKTLLLDYIGVASGATIFADSTSAFLTTLKKMSTQQDGANTIFCSGSSFSTSTAALFNAALAHSLDFDDTYMAGSVHPGVAVVSAALAQAEIMEELSIEVFLSALAVGYETVCRLSKAIGMGGYAQGFHNTSTTGIFGAVATISKLKGLSSDVTENAFGIALSKASGTMQYLENGSWNKRLHPGFAASDAFLCVSLAESGVVGAAKSIEGRYGLLNTYAQGANSELLAVQSLGHEWEFLKTAVKPFPACRMTHGQIEIAADLGTKAKAEQVKALTIGLSRPCFGVVGMPQQNRIHPKTVVDAQFSSYYQTAVAFLYGDAIGWGAYDHMKNPSVLDFSSKITVEIDAKLNGIESWVKVEWDDGTSEYKACMHPKGESERPLEWNDVQKKFESLVTPVYGEKRTKDIVIMVSNIRTLNVKRLMSVLGSKH